MNYREEGCCGADAVITRFFQRFELRGWANNRGRPGSAELQARVIASSETPCDYVASDTRSSSREIIESALFLSLPSRATLLRATSRFNERASSGRCGGPTRCGPLTIIFHRCFAYPSFLVFKLFAFSIVYVFRQLRIGDGDGVP